MYKQTHTRTLRTLVLSKTHMQTHTQLPIPRPRTHNTLLQTQCICRGADQQKMNDFGGNTTVEVRQATEQRRASRCKFTSGPSFRWPAHTISAGQLLWGTWPPGSVNHRGTALGDLTALERSTRR